MGTVVDTGKESHLGTRLVGLNGEGALDIVGIASDAYQNLHVWRNDAVASTSSTALTSRQSTRPDDP